MQSAVFHERLQADLVEVWSRKECHTARLRPINHARQMVSHGIRGSRRTNPSCKSDRSENPRANHRDGRFHWPKANTRELRPPHAERQEGQNHYPSRDQNVAPQKVKGTQCFRKQDGRYTEADAPAKKEVSQEAILACLFLTYPSY